jgi:uncharacterized protein
MIRARDDDSPFHAGERAVQQRVGVRAGAERLGVHMLRDAMSEQQRDFFASLPYVLVGSVDQRGRPWASILTGPVGFLSSPSEQQLDVSAGPLPSDPLASALRVNAPLGLLGIQLETRRRNRLNGRVLAASERGFSLRVDQSFGNCPRYISVRSARGRDTHAPSVHAEGAALSPQARALIAAADTCFVASASSALAGEDGLSDAREGVDVSHRGGKPGFVRVTDEGGTSVLTMPDFDGNNMFNTLGNLTRYPRAGLLFPDFERGDLLQLTCSAEIVFGGPELARFQGAQRLTRFRVEEGLYTTGALPFLWSPPEPSPFSTKTGDWESTEEG